MKKWLLVLSVILVWAPCGQAQDAKAPDGKSANVDRHGDPVPNGARARLGTVRFRHGLGAYQIAYSSDGKRLVSVGRFPGLCVWDAETGQLLQRVESVQSSYALALSPDGTKVFTGRMLFDAKSGKTLREFKDYGGAPETAAYSPDGAAVASSTFDDGAGPVVLWDAATGKELRVLIGHRQYVTALAYSPKDKDILASASYDKTIRIWNVATGKQLYRFDGDKAANSVAIAPDGTLLAGAGEDGVIRMWEVATGKPRWSIKANSGEIACIAFSRDGKLLACCGEGGVITLWNPESGKEVRRWETHVNYVSYLAFAPDGKTLASASNGTIRRWNFNTGAEIAPADGHHSSLLGLRFSKDGQTLLSCGQDRQIIEWDLATQKSTGRLFRGAIGETGYTFWRAVGFSPDGKSFAYLPLSVASNDLSRQMLTVRLVHAEQGKETHAFHHKEKPAAAIRFSPDGALLAIARTDGVHLCTTANGSPRHHWLGNFDIASVDFSPDGRSLIAADRGSHLHLIDVATGKTLRAWGSGLRVPQVAFAPNGQSIVAHDRQVIRVWSTETGTELLSVSVPEAVFAVQISPDGRVLAGAGIGFGTADDIIQFVGLRLWEMRTGQPIRQWTARQAVVRTLAYSPDGRTLATGGADATILLWNATGQTDAKPTKLDPVTLDPLWTDLAGPAPKADPAHWALVASPAQSIPVLKERLRPARAADQKQLGTLIAELDSENAAIRQKAERALIALGESAEAALRKHLRGPIQLELRRRIEHILDQRAADTLRLLRAIDVLAGIATPDARGVIESLARATPTPRVAQEATAAAKRIRK